MGKKQVRAQMRRVKPKAPAPGQMAQGTTRKQRERYVEAGGMLQGYAPDFVIRLGYIAIGVAVACLIVMAALILVLRPFYGWVGIMGQRMVGRVEPPVPPVMRQLQRLPVITPIALSLAVIIGDDVLAVVPVVSNEALHAALAAAVGAALGALVYFGSTFLQRRMMAEAQALVPTR